MEKNSTLLSLIVCSIDSAEVLHNHILDLIDVSSNVLYNVEIVLILGKNSAPLGLSKIYFNNVLSISSFTLGSISSSRNSVKIINRKFERLRVIFFNRAATKWFHFLFARLLKC